MSSPNLEHDRFAAEALKRWRMRPLRLLNVRSAVCTAAAMVLAVVLTRGAAHQALTVRVMAMVAMGFHGFLHMSFLSLLRHFQDRHVAGADAAERAYLDPRRITNLDLAIAWGTFATAVHLYRSLVPPPPG